MGISVLGVVGAGFMGSGIAETAAAAGKQVIVYEPMAGPLERSREVLAAAVAKAVSRGKLDVDAAKAMIDRIVYTSRFEDLADVDGVIEAISENADLKRELFARLGEQLAHAQFLASNTSSIPIAELAAVTDRPDRVLGLHFFSPVPAMKLVELVAALDTSHQTIMAAEEFVADVGKQAIHTKDRSGFVVNLLLVPYLMAAVRMFEEGFASAEDIDKAMKLGCGHPIGPLTLCDYVGLDVLYAVCDSLYEEFKRAEYAPPPLLKRMVASNRLGRKSGRGFYDYTHTPAPVAS
jgi:3-hydroxybutyryl-CoA dehydrogenase